MAAAAGYHAPDVILAEPDNIDSEEYEYDEDHGSNTRFLDGRASSPFLGDIKFLLPKEEAIDLTSAKSVYGSPVSSEEAAILLPPDKDEGGLIWHAQLVSDDWNDPKQCLEGGQIKPRRGTPVAREKDFFSSLVRTGDGRWIFTGVLNGWPAFTCFELLSITGRVRKSGFLSQSVGQMKIKYFWNADPNGPAPTFPAGPKSVRARLRMAPWTGLGWSVDSPGFVFWFFAQRPQGPLVAHGENMVHMLRSDVHGQEQVAPVAVRAHLFSHRYAMAVGKSESTKDTLVWHSAVLLEWDHGRFTTVVELATLNGLSGYRGKSNWYHDKLEDNPAFYRAMPGCMIAPWRTEFAEIRCADVPSKNLAEFKAFVHQYVGPGLRFLDPTFHNTGDVRIYARSQVDVMRYLLNYMGRDRRYHEEFRNCQFFATDLYGFLVGKKDIVPFSKVCQVTYKNRSHLFLYDPAMYKRY